MFCPQRFATVWMFFINKVRLHCCCVGLLRLAWFIPLIQMPTDPRRCVLLKWWGWPPKFNWLFQTSSMSCIQLGFTFQCIRVPITSYSAERFRTWTIWFSSNYCTHSLEAGLILRTLLSPHGYWRLQVLLALPKVVEVEVCLERGTCTVTRHASEWALRSNLLICSRFA